MKTLSKRTKILLATAGLLLVVIVLGIAVLQPGATGLFGTSALVITPTNPLIGLNYTRNLDVNAVMNCNWFSSNEAIIGFMDPPGTRVLKGVVIHARSLGTATIEARCGVLNVHHVSITLTVVNPPTVTPNYTTIAVGQKTTYSVGDTGTNCTWHIDSNQADHAYLSSPDAPDAIATNPAGPSVLVTGFTPGSAGIHAVCANGNVAGTVTVQ
jgi:hypothetical protein